MDRILTNSPRVLGTGATAPVSPGAKVYVYQGGTTTLIDLYTATIVASAPVYTLTTNPVIADASGFVPELFTDYAGPIKVVITAADDTAISTTEFAARVSTETSGAGSISYSPSTNIPDDNVQDALDTVSGFIEGWADGTAAAPGRHFTDDIDTGIFRPAANQIGHAVGGVLIETTTPGGHRVGQNSTENPAAATNTYGVGLSTSGFVSTSRNGDVAAFFNRNTSDGTLVSLRRSETPVGSIGVTTTATTFNTSSDYRLKVAAGTPVGWSAVDLVSDIATTLRHFTWNATGELDFGAFAHELQAVFPKAVTGEKDGPEMQAVDWSKMMPVALQAIAGLAARVEQLEQAQ
jgi:hypothetical protein